MLIELNGVRPKVAEGVYIAPTAVLIGDVTIGAGSSVWFGAVLRGDSGRIVIGERVSVQDNVVIHVNEHEDTIVEDDVLIGHAAVLEGCRIGREALIGMHATVLSGARVGERSLDRSRQPGARACPDSAGGAGSGRAGRGEGGTAAARAGADALRAPALY